MYEQNEKLHKLARACATRRDENRIHDIGLYFGAGQTYAHARKGVPVFIIMTARYHRTFAGAY